MRLRREPKLSSPLLVVRPLEATMKKSLLMACALLALTVGMASAAGLNLSWTDCNTSGQQNATFACAANTGINQLVGSYFPPGGITALTSNDGIVDLQTAGAVLSEWWRFDACRATALSMDANFLANGNCADYWQNLASLGFAAFYPRTLPNTERIKLSVALPDGSPAIGPVDPLVEYYSFRFTMTHAKSVGTGACAGCADAACIVLNELDLN